MGFWETSFTENPIFHRYDRVEKPTTPRIEAVGETVPDFSRDTAESLFIDVHRHILLCVRSTRETIRIA